MDMEKKEGGFCVFGIYGELVDSKRGGGYFG